MAARFVLCVVAVSDTEKYYFLSRADTYKGDIATATGITVAADADQDKPVTPVDSLVANGKMFRIAASYLAAGKLRTVKLLCSKAKLGSVLDDLKGKNYTGNNRTGQIKSVRMPQKAKFSF